MKPTERAAFLTWPRKLASYSAGELARISDLAPDLQRLWRRRGHLPEIGSGHARFSPSDVIEISIRYALSKFGVSPAESRTIDARAVTGAMYHALLNHHGSCEVIGPAVEVDRFLSDSEWPETVSDILGGPLSTNYLVWGDDESVRMIDDACKLFDQQTASVIAIDLAVIGARLMERGRKPILTVEVPPEFAIKRTRRLNGVGSNDS